MSGQLFFESSVGLFSITPVLEGSAKVELGVGSTQIGTFLFPEAAMAAVYYHETGWRRWDRLHGKVRAPELSDWTARPEHSPVT